MTRSWRGVDRAALVVATLLGVLVVAGPFLAPDAPTASVGRPFAAPSWAHPLGLDSVGRDVLSRVLAGGWRLVLLTGAALVVAGAIGVTAGLVAGLHRRLDGWVMRPVDVLVVLPWFLVMATVATVLGRGAPAVLVAALLAAVPWITKVVRTSAQDAAGAGYVEAAQARGEPFHRVAFVEVLPNLRAVVLADLGMRITATVAIVTSGSFLGLGLPPPTPDWALMVSENRQGLAVQPWAVLAPALLIMLLVVCVNLLADRVELARTPRVPRTERPTAAPDVAVATGALSVRRLGVAAVDGRVLLDGVGLDLAAGECVAVIGPSGAGKTTLARALLGQVPPGFGRTGTVAVTRPAGAVGTRLLGYVPQDPATGLNPALRIGTQLLEVLRAHGVRDRVGAAQAVVRALTAVGLPGDRMFLRRYPHELSGGQQQRVLIASAVLLDPAVVVLDEPTTGLDDRTTAELRAVLRRLRHAGTALVVVTHDLPAMTDLVDRVLEVRDGRARLVQVPDAPARPSRRRPVVRAGRAPLLRVTALTAGYGTDPLLRDVSFELAAGECLALMGRSGTGKSTLARCLVGLHPLRTGQVVLDGRPLAPRATRRSVADRRAVQFVVQNPRRSLNPSRTVAHELARPLRLLRGSDRAAVGRESAELLAAVGLHAELLTRRPAELSGGQLQRVAIARALAAHPQVLVCDEITSSLDPDVQATVLELLDRLRRQRDLAVLFISHDSGAVARVADRVLRLSDGQLEPEPEPIGGPASSR
ncbi:ABC transporter ATP-binding protein/permease [Nakamurella leprariae]|uniref:ATP-binding cassette domain-containing protein n=1 Tax=Nakamurella leprariae TaxID=2803911 RepID=A0A938YG66_9ACTN|nr:ATP-binding cassette domain-containing protein [Nakamurella leprariae]MBM9469294.1 ATP-binding cassette domain-containing protein [Nakamurella leprariae]